MVRAIKFPKQYSICRNDDWTARIALGAGFRSGRINKKPRVATRIGI
jgi:hypothetical protein